MRTLNNKPNQCVSPVAGLVLIVSLAATVQLAAQTAGTPPLVSPEVLPDSRVTFRLGAPNAAEVLLDREGAKRVPLQKDSEGIWSVTVGPLEPDFYGYSFVVDGVTMFDPANRRTKFNFLYTANVVHVPGPRHYLGDQQCAAWCRSIIAFIARQWSAMSATTTSMYRPAMTKNPGKFIPCSTSCMATAMMPAPGAQSATRM